MGDHVSPKGRPVSLIWALFGSRLVGFSDRLHRISTDRGLPGGTRTGTLTELRLGAVVECGSPKLPATGKQGTLTKQEKHSFAPRHDWVALVWMNERPGATC